MAIGVHAEGSHLVAVLLGAVNQLGFVHHVGDVLEHRGGQLHPHAHVHLVVQQLQPQPLALVGEPLRPGAARARDEIGGGIPRPALRHQGVHAVPCLNGRHGGVEQEGMPVPDGLIDAGEDFQVVFRPQVLALGLEQMQVIFQRLPLQRLGLGGGGGVHLGGGAVLHVEAVHIADEVHDLPLLQEIGEPAAKGGGEVEFPVGEGPRPAKAAHGAAHPALDAGADLARHDGALAAVDIRPLVHHQHPGGGAFQRQLIGGVDAGLAGAQDHHVVIGIHTAAPLLAVGVYRQYIVPWNTPRRKGAISLPPEGRPPSKRYHFQLSVPPSGGDGRPVLNRGAGCDKIGYTPMVLGAFS